MVDGVHITVAGEPCNITNYDHEGVIFCIPPEQIDVVDNSGEAHVVVSTLWGGGVPAISVYTWWNSHATTEAYKSRSTPVLTVLYSLQQVSCLRSVRSG